MDINSFIEPATHVGEHLRQIPEQAQQFFEAHIPTAPKLPEAPTTSILGS